MKKIINTFRYGTFYTKKILIFTLIDIIAFVAFCVLAVRTRHMIYFFGAVASVFIFISLVQTMGIHGLDDDTGEASGDRQSKQRVNKNSASLPVNENSKMPEQEKHSGQKVKKEKLSKANKPVEKIKKEKLPKDKISKQKKMKKNKGKGIRFSLKDLFSFAKKQPAQNKPLETGKKTAKQTIKQTVKEKESGVREGTSKKVSTKESSDEDREYENKNLVVIRQASDETADSYDRKKIKKTLHKYKVKKDHRLVLVDFSKKYAIKQCPAYIWVSDKQFNMLLLEEETRHIAIPLGRIREITYLKKQSANADTDYPMFHRENLLTNLFRPYLPDYTYNTVASDVNSHKNLYGITGGIYFTNKSAKNLFDLLGVEFHVDDKVTTSTKVNIFFKDAYKANIMLRDSVLDANGYADSIANTLENMTKSTISYGEFKDTLNLMIKNKLITQEFALYYMGLWDKLKR